jgi:hypothetical protein
MPQVAWSFSALKTFQSCPKKYYHLKVLKDVKEQPSEIMLYGIDAHKAAELYIANNQELPGKYEFMRKQLDKLKELDGEKYCEFKFGLTKEMQPCDFFAKDVWLRGAIDLLVVNTEKGIARMIDYKFGKSKNADMSQLQLMSLAVFKMFPEIKKVKAGLLFCAEDKMMPVQYEQDKAPVMWMDWLPEVARLEASYENNVWNPNPSGLCKAWCPVVSCVHNGKR